MFSKIYKSRFPIIGDTRNKIVTHFTIIFVLCIFCVPVSAEIYVYKDEKGVMHWSDHQKTPEYKIFTSLGFAPVERKPKITKRKIIRAQKLLKELELDPGPIDGILGGKTRNAIKSFQRSIRAEVTGVVDYNLISQMRIVAAKKGREENAESQNINSLAIPKVNIPKPLKVLPVIPPKQEKVTVSAVELFQKVESSIYTILSASSKYNFDINGGEIFQGSAVAISSNKLLTNYHVIKDKPVVFISQGKDLKSAKIIGQNEIADLCVIEIAENSLKPIRAVRKFKDLKIGEEVYTIGSPKGFEKTLSDGMISSLRKREGIRYIQINAAISVGSSGGGLFDSRGNLIGITTFNIKGSQNLNFAVAIEEYWN
jgi:Trypsin-like peptidase domain/Putative peptidoglycan binding domain/Domain of unknown function (DUF4124)